MGWVGLPDPLQASNEGWLGPTMPARTTPRKEDFRMIRSRKLHLLILLTSLPLMTCAALSFGQQPGPAQGAAKKVGEALDTTGRAIRRGLQGAGETVREGFERTRASVQNMNVVSRVYSRLHWDKSLANAMLDIEVKAGGVVILRGVVNDNEAKARAVSLAADTVGVAKVIDQLSLSVPSRVIPAQPGTGTGTGVDTGPATTTTTQPGFSRGR